MAAVMDLCRVDGIINPGIAIKLAKIRAHQIRLTYIIDGNYMVYGTLPSQLFRARLNHTSTSQLVWYIPQFAKLQNLAGGIPVSLP